MLAFDLMDASENVAEELSDNSYSIDPEESTLDLCKFLTKFFILDLLSWCSC